MNQVLSPDAVEDMMTTAPVAVVKRPMNRTQKLLRWSEVVAAYPGQIMIFHMLEAWNPNDLRIGGHPSCAFQLAGADPVLQDEGIKMDIPPGDNIYRINVPLTSAAEVMRFFELTQQQLHEFSCNCGGYISNAEMAARIEGIAIGA